DDGQPDQQAQNGPVVHAKSLNLRDSGFGTGDAYGATRLAAPTTRPRVTVDKESAGTPTPAFARPEWRVPNPGFMFIITLPQTTRIRQAAGSSPRSWQMHSDRACPTACGACRRKDDRSCGWCH